MPQKETLYGGKSVSLCGMKEKKEKNNEKEVVKNKEEIHEMKEEGKSKKEKEARKDD